jgi:cell surface protein SprA
VDPVPDTEDMNLNEALDKVEDYFEYSIDLGDSAQRYLETDVQRDFPGYPSVVPWNGWRRYRIPINDSLRVAFGVPDLTIARHVRVWLDGIVESDSTTAEVQRPLLMLGGTPRSSAIAGRPSR